MLTTKTRISTVGFCDQFVTINSHGMEAYELVDFLCCDLQEGSGASTRAIYELRAPGKESKFSLCFKDKELFSGNCRYELAYSLINEILHHCIVGNTKGNVIHAAAIGSMEYGVLLPGKSGSGKSTFTAWLISRGCNYLTDELVVILDQERCLVPFTRPLSIKSGSVEVLSSFLRIDPKYVITGSRGFMLPHRQINPNFSANTPHLSLILFPVYVEGTEIKLKRLSPALGCAKLMECYVNARNIQGHGFSSLAKLTRTVPVFQLSYGSFDGLRDVLDTAFPKMF